MAKKYKGPYSCVAVWQGQNNRAEIIHNDQGNNTTPSFVAFTNSQRLIGDAAKNQAASNPTNTVFGNLSFYFRLVCKFHFSRIGHL
jgi:molecular chaperone DnaK (HSP70)